MKKNADELARLIGEISRATNLSQEEIGARAGYAKGYITQALSRGSVPEKLLRTLRREYSEKISPPRRTIPDVDSYTATTVLRIGAMMEVVLEVLAEAEAGRSGRPVTAVLAQYSEAVRAKIKGRMDQL
jgi:hypothetical protein